MRVCDACLIVAWAQQWEIKTQFNGDQNKQILCQKKNYVGFFYNMFVFSQLQYLVLMVPKSVLAVACSCLALGCR